MLIYSYKLANYIKKQILPKVLLSMDSYEFKGSFRRRAPYITDIDIINKVYPKINHANILDVILKKIAEIQADPTIILIYVNVGYDDRFKLESIDDLDKIENIRSLLSVQKQLRIDNIIASDIDLDRKLYYLDGIIRPHYKLHWSLSEIAANQMILPGNHIVHFDAVLKENSVLLLKYYVQIESQPVGIDIVVIYEPINLPEQYRIASERTIRTSNYNSEYFFMLFPLRHYFRTNTIVRNEIEDFIEKRFGLFKQMIVKIEGYIILYLTGNLSMKWANSIVRGIIKDLPRLYAFDSDRIVATLKTISEENPPDTRKRAWHIVLSKLYDKLNAHINAAAKSKFFQYLKLIPKTEQTRFYLE